MFNRCENCNHTLTDEQLEKIVDLAVQKITDKFFIEIGRSVFDKFLLVVGAASVGIYFILKSKGIIND